MSFWENYKQHAPLCLLGLLSLFCVVVWVLVWAHTPRGMLRIAVLNIGQGDAIYLESPTGRQVLIDGGPDDTLLSALPPVMPPFDRSIDAIIETHPDSDHFTGFIHLLQRYQVGAFIEPGIAKDTLSQTTLEREVLDAHISRYIARRGMVLALGGGAELDILYPDHDVSHLNPKFDNNGCIVARLVYGATSALFTCDAPKEVEARLMAEHDALATQGLQSNLLKVAHHGSHFSTSAAFVAAVHPQFAAISVGQGNKYGHPNQETLDTLAAAGVPTLRTDQAGTLVFESDGTTLRLEK